MKETIEKVPTDVLMQILSYAKHRDLVNTNMACKAFHDKTSPTLKEFKSIYEKHSASNAEEILQASLNSLKVTQAVVMSKLLNKLNKQQIIGLACSSYAHAEIILKSRLTNKYNALKGVRSTKANIESTLQEDLIDIQDLINSTVLSAMEIEDKNDPNINIIMAIAKKNANYPKLVIQHALERLNGYRLMEIAKISVEHAKVILSTTASRQRLKPGHIIGIGRSSLEHAKYIVSYYLLTIGSDGAKQIAAQGDDYVKAIFIPLLNHVTALPITLIQNKLEFTKPIATLIITKKFYHPNNKIWQNYSKKHPNDAKVIEEATKLLKLDNNQCINYMLKRFMGLSVKHAEEILAIKGIEKILNSQTLQTIASINSDYNELINRFLDKQQANISANMKEYRP
jgi:hypothetical protein